MAEIGSKSSPNNLAGNDRSLTTANSYIVNGPGWYKFPLVYGNALKNGSANKPAYAGPGMRNHLNTQISNPWIKNNGITIGSAELRWQDTPSGAPLIDASSIAVEGDYIKFHIPAGQTCVQGNAVIAVKDRQGRVAWSWHIWVTLHKTTDTFNFNGKTFFSSLLGYREAELVVFPERELYIKLVQSESGLVQYVHVNQEHLYQYVNAGNAPYYQHGRKDPFPGASLIITRSSNGSYSMRVLQDRIAEFSTRIVDSSCTLGYAVQHPDTYIGQYWVNGGGAQINNINWYWYQGLGLKDDQGVTTGYNNLWDYDKIKTVYDPCPVNYKIPSDKEMKAVESIDISNVEYVNTGIHFINNRNTNNEERFFLQILGSRGYDVTDNGKVYPYLTASLLCTGSNGSTVVSFLLFSPTQNPSYWISSGTSCQGQCVLPIKE